MKSKLNMKTKLVLSLALWFCGSILKAQSWNEIIKASASDRSANDQFGYSVAVSGDYAVVGAPLEDEDAAGGGTLTDAGSAYIFVRSGSTWIQQQKVVASDRAANDNFGYSVDISGDYVIVGAYREDENISGSATLVSAGSAYIFQRNGNTWSQLQKIVASDRSTAAQFGLSVAINDNYAVIGASQDGLNEFGSLPISNAGSAYIFVRSGSTWTQQQKIVASDRGSFDEFGFTVAISGDYVVVGAPFNDEPGSGDVGSAYIFNRSGSTWTQQQKILASDFSAADEFGNSVAISGDYVIVGAYREDHDVSGGALKTDAGSAYIFLRSGNTWSQQQKIVAADRDISDRFGSSVAIHGNYVVVGASNESHNALGTATLNAAGSAYIFERTGNVWAQQQKIVASDRSNVDKFGSSVAISGDYAIIGAPYNDESISGGTAVDVGSAYIFFKTQPLPSIASFTPASGCVGTSTITITGVNFTGATAVTIGGTNVSSFVVNSDTQITTTIGNGTTGLIEVVTPFGLAVSSSSFTVNALPTANISGATTGCGSVSLTATGGNVYAWSGGSSSNLPVNTFSISNIYTVTVTDSNNCSATASASVNVALPSLWYEDLDGDGYGNAQVTISDCIQPANYVSNNTDCNDADNSQWQSAGLYVDADNDGYDAGTATVCYGASIPSGYKATTLGSDCDDTDANRNVSFSFYADTDGDGFGSGSLVSGICAVNSSTAPAGYSTNNTDCTPTNGNTWQLIPGYVDADSDSFTVGSMQNVCSGSSLPPGFIGSTLGNDEDDNNPSITTGIIDLSGGEGSVNIYPNPTSRALSVNFGNGHSYNRIQLTDATGKLLYETSISASTSEKQINAADLSEGVYFLVLSGSKHHKTLRFVKQ